MIQWILAGAVLVVAIVVTSPWWMTFLESLTGREDDYEARIEARNGHVPPRARPTDEEMRKEFGQLAAPGSFAGDLARTHDP